MAVIQFITSDFGCEPHQILSINQCFTERYSCYFQSECAVGQVLEALYMVDSGWRVWFDDADWWSKGVNLYPIGKATCGWWKEVPKLQLILNIQHRNQNYTEPTMVNNILHIISFTSFTDAYFYIFNILHIYCIIEVTMLLQSQVIAAWLPSA